MIERVRSPDVTPEFWDWLFRALSSEGPSSGQNAEGATTGAGRACKKLRLYERPSLAIAVAAPALHTAASCLGSPPLLPPLAEFLLRHESRLASVSRDTWQMTRVFLQRFPSADSLGNYDEGDGEFPCLLDSFVEEIRRESISVANNSMPLAQQVLPEPPQHVLGQHHVHTEQQPTLQVDDRDGQYSRVAVW
eukprot:CAMPEP_0172926594 /NCGR_PEP_ID=MMETSP1075-20121228/215853_1 /TAXON_ID=2916 /ORGANISM="Ceratium fusus, Strain PA161109" /LENGTH=191 /DNA_ID=CAMNT_0013787689 /DNA_START=124 /DNA_END=697 /DNA_ORIENTATION=-